MAGNNRVAVQKSIDSNSTIIHYVVEKFNNEEVTYFEIGRRHYMILMLFQNAGNCFNEDQRQQISKVSAEFVTKRQSLEQMLECLKLVKDGNIAARAEMPGNCETNRNYNFQRSSSTVSKQYNAWMLNYHFLE